MISAAADIDVLRKGGIDTTLPENQRRVKDKELRWVESLKTTDAIQAEFNTRLFTAGDSRDPEQAGVWRGGRLTTDARDHLTLSFPFGGMAAVYLEEFAPKNRWTDIIEVNINNLAAVPRSFSASWGLLSS